MKAFEEKLQRRIERSKLPEGYGIRSSEQGPFGYDQREIIPLGRRGKTIELELQNEVWLPRAQLWCQALHQMHRLLSPHQ